MKFEHAEKIATELRDMLAPSCLRIEIAGSIRRRKPEVKDIELVAIPKHGQQPGTLFDTEMVSLLSHDIDVLVARKQLEFDAETPRNGDKYKRLRFKEMAVDLFIVTPESWGVQFLLRTGPAEFSHRLVTPREHGGYLPENMRISGGRVLNFGEPLKTPEEQDVFGAVGLTYIFPEHRQ